MDHLLWIGMAVAAAAVLVIGAIVLTGLAIPYLILRLKAEAPEDTQLGAKIAFQFFFSCGILVVVSGVTMLAVDWLTLYPYRNVSEGRTTFSDLVEQGFSVGQRAGAGLILCGAVAVVAHLFLVHSLQGAHRLRIQRLFVGWRLAIHGVVVMIALGAVVVLILQKGPFDEPVESPLRAATATLVVWGISWGVHLERLLTLTKRRMREPDVAGEAQPTPRISAAEPAGRASSSVEPSDASFAFPAVSIAAPVGAVAAPSDDDPIVIVDDEPSMPAVTAFDLETPLRIPGDDGPAGPEAGPADGPPPLPAAEAVERSPAAPAAPSAEVPSEGHNHPTGHD